MTTSPTRSSTSSMSTAISSNMTMRARARSSRCVSCRRASASCWASCRRSAANSKPRIMCGGGSRRRRNMCRWISCASRRNAASPRPRPATSSPSSSRMPSWPSSSSWPRKFGDERPLRNSTASTGRAAAAPNGKPSIHRGRRVMAGKNLEEIVKSVNPVEMLRNSQLGAYVYPVVPSEFTNWRDEQMAWRKTAVLFDQSHHMAEMMVTGPDAFKFMNYLTINSFANFPVNRAKQFVPCSYDGYVIGDGILFNLAENQLNFVGRAPTVDWIQFHGEQGKFKIKMERDDRSPSRPGGKPVTRRHYRYQIQGPNAAKILNKLNGAPIPDVKFFTMDTINIAGRKVRCLRHGMAGEPGLEVWGPWAEGDEVRNAILEAGKEFGIVAVGSRAYATN